MNQQEQSDALESAPADQQDEALPERTRKQVVRDVLVFQLKLLADGFRDLLLSPISIILGLIGVFISKRPGEPFYRLLRAGRATEHWIDLFGDAYAKKDDEAADEKRQTGRKELENTLRDLERSLRNEDYEQGSRDGAKRIRAAIEKYF